MFTCSRIPYVLFVGLLAIGCASEDPDPIIPYMFPDVGVIAGGDVVTIATQGFEDDFQVHPPEVIFGFGPSPSVTAVSGSIVEAVTPPSPSEGPVDVVVRSVNEKQTAVEAGGYTYALPPVILSVDPYMGHPNGGEIVEIETRDFLDDFRMHTPAVLFGGVISPRVTATGAGGIEVETPRVSWNVELVDLTVESTGLRQIATLPDGFLYTTFPISPTHVDLLGEIIPLPTASAIYVLDRGASMSWSAGSWTDRFGNVVTGSKWDRVADLTLASIATLEDTALFNVYTYSCVQDSFSPAMVPAIPANKAGAEAYLLGAAPMGGSGEGPAGAAALSETANGTLFFVSDGMPGCGASGTVGHKMMILAANTQAARITSVGIQDAGVDQAFLRELAEGTGGMYIHIR